MEETESLDCVSFMIRYLRPGDFPAAVKCALIELDIPTDTKGYRCLVAAIPLYHTDLEQFLTKELYPEVGKRMGQRTIGGRVEKQIRDTISEAWKRRDTKVWNRYFPPDQKPTNGAFISRISELLSLWEDCLKEKAETK